MRNLLNSKQATTRGLMAPVSDRERNPDRTRAAILDAAEKLFAAKGFEATSLNEVGTAAGVSRGTPGYFFGSKADLYQAVLDRSFAEVREAVRAGPGPGAGQQPEPRGHPRRRRLRLLRLPRRPPQLHPADRARGAQRRAPARRGEPPLAGQEALAAISAELGLDDSPSGEAAQLLLSIIALCWFHLIHARTVAPGRGRDAGERRATSSGAGATSSASSSTGSPDSSAR